MSTSAAAVESGNNLAEVGILDRIIAETKLTPDDEAYDIAKRGVCARCRRSACCNSTRSNAQGQRSSCRAIRRSSPSRSRA